MSKEVEWSEYYGEGEIVCRCDQCGEEYRHQFDGSPDYRGAQEAIRDLHWFSRKIDSQWYDFCSDECYYRWIKENK